MVSMEGGTMEWIKDTRHLTVTAEDRVLGEVEGQLPTVRHHMDKVDGVKVWNLLVGMYIRAYGVDNNTGWAYPKGALS